MGKKTNTIGSRMKGYEQVSKTFLPRRIPVIIRLDGKAFHSFTKGMKRPFDALFRTVMEETMRYLCQNIQGCVFGYTQSDEISLVLTDYAMISTDAWFGYSVQKMCSVAASMATLAFNRIFAEEVTLQIKLFPENIMESSTRPPEDFDYLLKLQEKFLQAMFDARAFSVPKEEVCNCLIWRQQDATRNSIESVGQFYFSQKELNGKNCNEIQDMLWKQKGVNWNDYPVRFKRGSCCYRGINQSTMSDPRDPGNTITVERRVWIVDDEPPIFTQDRNYIEKWL